MEILALCDIGIIEVTNLSILSELYSFVTNNLKALAVKGLLHKCRH